MHTKEIGKGIFQIDLETGGFKQLIASYILRGEKNLIVDSGPTSSIPNLLLGLKEIGIKPQDVSYLALTHIHVDHGGGVGTLLKSLPKAKVIVHPRGLTHIVDPARLWAASKETLGFAAETFGAPEPVPQDKILLASEGLTFNLGAGLTLKTIETPGHAAHNLSYYEHLNKSLFAGDSAGAYFPEYETVFPTTPPPFRPDVALISIDKMIKLNPEALCYSHFGKASNATKRLREYAIQIEMWLNIIKENIKLGKSDVEIREAIFQEDDTVQHIIPMLKANAFHRKTLIENSVQGFIDFAKNPQI